MDKVYLRPYHIRMLIQHGEGKWPQCDPELQRNKYFSRDLKKLAHNLMRNQGTTVVVQDDALNHVCRGCACNQYNDARKRCESDIADFIALKDKEALGKYSLKKGAEYTVEKLLSRNGNGKRK